MLLCTQEIVVPLENLEFQIELLLTKSINFALNNFMNGHRTYTNDSNISTWPRRVQFYSAPHIIWSLGILYSLCKVRKGKIHVSIMCNFTSKFLLRIFFKLVLHIFLPHMDVFTFLLIFITLSYLQLKITRNHISAVVKFKWSYSHTVYTLIA